MVGQVGGGGDDFGVVSRLAYSLASDCILMGVYGAIPEKARACPSLVLMIQRPWSSRAVLGHSYDHLPPPQPAFPIHLE